MRLSYGAISDLANHSQKVNGSEPESTPSDLNGPAPWTGHDRGISVEQIIS